MPKIIKGEEIMATILEVRAMIEQELNDLKSMDAEKFCADKVAEIYAQFNLERDANIKKLENTLETLDYAQQKLEELEKQAVEEQPTEV